MPFKPKENLRIIVADDHPFYLKGIKSVLNRLAYVGGVKGAENGLEVLKLLKDNNGDCDIIFMDITMPKMDGIEATQKVSMQFPGVLVIAITMIEDYNSAIKMFDAGARGYLSKDINREELELAIEKVLAGEYYYSKKISDVLLKKLKQRNIIKTAPAHQNNISEREMEVLYHTCEGLSAEQIADELNISPHTVITHRKSLFEKTNTVNIVGLLKYAIGKGLYEMPQ